MGERSLCRSETQNWKFGRTSAAHLPSTNIKASFYLLRFSPPSSLPPSQLQHSKRVNNMQTPGHVYPVTDGSIVAAVVQRCKPRCIQNPACVFSWLKSMVLLLVLMSIQQKLNTLKTVVVKIPQTLPSNWIVTYLLKCDFWILEHAGHWLEVRDYGLSPVALLSGN